MQYGEVGSGSTQTMPLSGGTSSETTIAGLFSSSIQVAAVNSAGTGAYSTAIIAETEESLSEPYI